MGFSSSSEISNSFVKSFLLSNFEILFDSFSLSLSKSIKYESITFKLMLFFFKYSACSWFDRDKSPMQDSSWEIFDLFIISLPDFCEVLFIFDGLVNLFFCILERASALCFFFIKSSFFFFSFSCFSLIFFSYGRSS